MVRVSDGTANDFHGPFVFAARADQINTWKVSHRSLDRPGVPLI